MTDTVPTPRRPERHLLEPPLAATFRGSAVAVCDISAEGVRFRHHAPLQTGTKSVLLIAADGRPAPIALETMIVWTQPDPALRGTHVSGGRTWGHGDGVRSLIEQLQAAGRTTRIEESRSTERFTIAPRLAATFDGHGVTIDNLSTRGAGIELSYPAPVGLTTTLAIAATEGGVDVRVAAKVRWSAMKTIGDSTGGSWRTGLRIDEKPELLRLVIGHLSELGRASIDPDSLRLKLKVLRARARQLAPAVTESQTRGLPAEQYLLIQGVREELRLNANVSMHWYRRARLMIADPATRDLAPQIAQHPDALAVWEYLDRSIDPSIVGRAFELPEQ
jgi:hypothetical protein